MPPPANPEVAWCAQESFWDRMFDRVAGAGTQLKYENIVYSPEDRFRLQVPLIMYRVPDADVEGNSIATT